MKKVGVLQQPTEIEKGEGAAKTKMSFPNFIFLILCFYLRVVCVPKLL